MGNFTYGSGIPKYPNCKFPGIFTGPSQQIPATEYVKNNLFYTMPDNDGNVSSFEMVTLNNSLEDLRFVVCGRRGSSMFMYNQLSGAYQPSVWTALLLTYVSSCRIT